MRNALPPWLGRALGPALAALALTGSAGADVLPVELELSLEGVVPGSGTTTATGLATVNGSAGGAHVASLALPGGVLTSQGTNTPATTSVFTQTLVSLANASGTFTGGAAGPLRGALAIEGQVRFCLAFGCALFLDVPFTQNGTRGIGLGGDPITTSALGVALSLAGGSWTTGTVSLVTSNGTLTRQGLAHGPLSGTSSTAAPGGELQLVTPIAITVLADPPTSLPLFGGLTVRFAPEPAGWGAGAVGVAALALGAHRRRRQAAAFSRNRRPPRE